MIRQVVVEQNDDESEFDLHYRLQRHGGSLVAVETDAEAVKGAQARSAAKSDSDKAAEHDAEWLAYIADAAGDDGWAARPDVLEHAPVKERQARTILANMVKRGVLRQEKRAGQGKACILCGNPIRKGALPPQTIKYR